AVAPHAPLHGIEAGGWKLVYNDKPNAFIVADDQVHRRNDWTFSLGLMVGQDGQIADVVAGSAAARAGLAPGMKILARGGRRFDAAHVGATIRASKADKNAIEVIAENGDYVRAFRLDYHGGARHPHLERANNRPDALSDAIKALSK